MKDLNGELNELCYLFQDIVKFSNSDDVNKINEKTEKWERQKKKIIDRIKYEK